MTDIKKHGYYVKKDLAGWSLGKGQDSLQIKKGHFKGRSYSNYNKEISHGGMWKFRKGLLAFTETFLTLGLALISKDVRNTWKKATSGKERLFIKVLNEIKTPTKPADPIKQPGDSTAPSTPGGNSTQTAQQIGQTQLNNGDGQQAPEGTDTNLPPVPTKPTIVVTTEETPLPEVGKEGELPKDGLLFKLPPSKVVEDLDAKALEKARADQKAKMAKSGGLRDYLQTVVEPGKENCISAFMNIPVKEWVDNQGLHVMAVSGKSDLNQLNEIKNAINQLVTERYVLAQNVIGMMGQPDKKTTTLGDLDLPWDKSVLKMKFTSADDLGKMTLTEIKNLSPEQRKILNEDIAKNRFRVTKALNLNDVKIKSAKDMTLEELRATANMQVIRSELDKLSVDDLELLTEKQIQSLISAFDQMQFDHFYGVESELVKDLTTPYLEDYIVQCKKFWLDSPLEISDSLYHKINMKSETVDAAIFNYIISAVDDCSLLGKLSKEQVSDAIERKLFNSTTVEYIDPKIIAALSPEINKKREALTKEGMKKKEEAFINS